MKGLRMPLDKFVIGVRIEPDGILWTDIDEFPSATAELVDDIWTVVTALNRLVVQNQVLVLWCKTWTGNKEPLSLPDESGVTI